jgi:tetratricopeptide (TPR) repeat protein
LASWKNSRLREAPTGLSAFTVAIGAAFLLACGCGQAPQTVSTQEKFKELLRGGRLADAEELCRKLVARGGEEVLVHRGNLAAVLCRRGEAKLEQAGFFDADESRSAASRKQPEWSQAMAFFAGAVSQCRGVLGKLGDDPRKTAAYAKVRGTLGLALYRQGRVKEAMNELERAVAEDPRLAAAHNTLGMIFHELGKGEAAAANFKAALQADPGLAEAAYNLGLYYQEELEELGRIEARARQAGARPPRGTENRKRTARRQAIRYYRQFLRERGGKRGRWGEVQRRLRSLQGSANGACRQPAAGCWLAGLQGGAETPERTQVTKRRYGSM